MTVVEIKQAIQHLSSEDFGSLMLWIAEYNNNKWDKQIEQDYNARKLNHLINAALADIANGDVKEL
ncbi:MAG: hypothetical protein JZU70_11260 [Chlorobium sp.]|jgi:hypothetical protein|nr:hypothetical protein [Chlorobium sp.]